MTAVNADLPPHLAAAGKKGGKTSASQFAAALKDALELGATALDSDSRLAGAPAARVPAASDTAPTLRPAAASPASKPAATVAAQPTGMVGPVSPAAIAAGEPGFLSHAAAVLPDAAPRPAQGDPDLAAVDAPALADSQPAVRPPLAQLEALLSAPPAPRRPATAGMPLEATSHHGRQTLEPTPPQERHVHRSPLHRGRLATAEPIDERSPLERGTLHAAAIGDPPRDTGMDATPTPPVPAPTPPLASLAALPRSSVASSPQTERADRSSHDTPVNLSATSSMTDTVAPRLVLRRPFGAVGEDAVVRPVPATVIRRETHFAPIAAAVPSAPAPQAELLPPPRKPEQAAAAVIAPGPEDVPLPVLAQVRDALDAVAAPETGSTTVHERPPAAGPAPLRIIELQLQPATLGTVTVTLRLSSAGLKVSVAASVRETAQRLADDRTELGELVRRAGYGDADVTVEFAAPADGSPRGDANDPGSDGSGGSTVPHRPQARSTFEDAFLV